MTVARSQLVDVSVTRYYHCISRCVRRAFLCGEGYEHRKQWIEDRLEALSQAFAVSVCGFSVMDNHLHVLARLDTDDANRWSAEEIVRRWSLAYPRKNAEGEEIEVSQEWIDDLAKDEQRVERLRERLASLGWFMKALKEPLARLANKEDGCQGTFWESRYKSIAILDRLGSDPGVWSERIGRLFSKARLLGSCFTTDRKRLRDLARERGVHHLDDLAASAA